MVGGGAQWGGAQWCRGGAQWVGVVHSGGAPVYTIWSRGARPVYTIRVRGAVPVYTIWVRSAPPIYTMWARWALAVYTKMWGAVRSIFAAAGRANVHHKVRDPAALQMKPGVAVCVPLAAADAFAKV